MAKPIEFGLVLEGEDAKEFIKNIENPAIVTDEIIQMLKKGREIYEKNRF
jgi:hypothetical protein